MPSVGLFGRSDAAPFPAISRGFSRLGWDVVWQRPSVWREDQALALDAVVTHGAREGYGGRIGGFYRAHGTPVLVADLPAIRVDGYWALWREHVNRIPREAPGDRGGILPVVTGRALGPVVVVCGQKDGDQAHEMDAATLRSYSERTLKMLRSKVGPDRPIEWRPHPQWPFAIEGFDYNDPHGSTWAGQLERPDLGAIVTHNSTCGLSALAAGLPVWCSERAFYAEAARHGLPPPDLPPPAPDPAATRRLLERVGYTQWTEAEFATGEPMLWALEHGG